jgi:hypothetical protein
LPVPGSPVSSVGTDVSATPCTDLRTSCIALDRPNTRRSGISRMAELYGAKYPFAILGANPRLRKSSLMPGN